MNLSLISKVIALLGCLFNRKQTVENKKISPTEINTGDITIIINIDKD